MRRILLAPAALIPAAIPAVILAGLAVFWAITTPRPLPENAFAGLTGNARAGEAVFWAAGCAACHAAPGAKAAALPELGGGQRFPSPFGTFVAPNISPDPTHGIGGWTLPDLANAVMRGIAPDGRHYYPAFPYGSYNKADPQDIADLKAFLDTLPPVATPSQPHEVGFPFSIRRNLGLWKALFLRDGWVVADDLPPDQQRGRYLVEALGHCGECHTPRNALGGWNRSLWLAGAPNPSGKGSIPNITPGKLNWTEAEIVEYLTSGFTPDFDSAGGLMVHVVENTARLPASDRRAVANYLKRLPPRP